MFPTFPTPDAVPTSALEGASRRSASGAVLALRPLAPDHFESGRIREEELRLLSAWPRLVGPALASRSRLLAARHGALVLGCWDPTLLSELRRSAEATWPTLRRRVHTLFGITLNSIRVEPCDPPPVPPDPVPAGDLLGEVLRRYKSKVKQGLAPPPA
ncbi:MAG: DUF721 domain-containing protein [Acidobacteria bacterium]|nr:DUF721 domain-containing protein [Acidobacteriota bacterium]